MSDKAGDAARRIEKAFTTGGAYSGDDPVTVARAYLSSSKRIEELEAALQSALHALKMDAPHRSEIEEIEAALSPLRAQRGSNEV